MEFKIREGAVDKMAAYVAKVNRRAVKMGLKGLSVREVSREFVKQDADNPDSPKVVEVTFDVTGDTPKINGWDFISRIEHDPKLGNMVFTAPGKELPKHLWNRAGECDHCNKSRYRKDTFVLRNEAGEYKQIGRQCVRDFIGYENPANMYWWVSIFDSLNRESSGWNGYREVQYYSVEQVLAMTFAASKEFGYVSRKMVNENPDRYTTTTGSEVWSLLTSLNKDLTPREREVRLSAKNFTADAEKIVAWVKTWNPDTANEFEQNVTKIINAGVCRSRDFGLVACLPTIYAYKMNEIKEKAARPVSDFVGTVGMRSVFVATVKKVMNLGPSRFAYNQDSYLSILEDAHGNVMKYFNVVGSEGETVKFKATVKKHDEYKGVKQTLLSRCSVLSK